MNRNNHTNERRTVLQALAAGITGSTAGCLDELVGEATPESSSTLSPTDTSMSTTTETTPSSTATPTEVAVPATPNYTDWVFSTELMEDSWPVRVQTVSPATISKYGDQLNSDAANIFNQVMEFPLVAAQVNSLAVTEVIGTRGVYVMKGDFEQRVVDRNRLKEFERKPPEYRGFLLYENAEDGEALGAKDGVVVATDRPGQSVGPMEVLKRVIDTADGDEVGLLDQRSEVDPLASWLGDRTVSEFTTHQPYTDRIPTGKIGAGIGFEFNESSADTRYVVQFEDESQATDEAVDTWLDQIPYPDDWTNKTRNHYGEIVVVDGQVTYDTMLSLNS